MVRAHIQYIMYTDYVTVWQVLYSNTLQKNKKISLYLSFWEFSSWNVKKKKKKLYFIIKREKNVVFFKKGGGGGRALLLQAPMISTIYIFYRYPLLGIKGWQVRKRVF